MAGSGTVNLLRVVAITLSAQAATALMALTPAVVAVVAAPDLGVAARDVGFFAAMVFLASMLTSVAGGGLIARYGAIRVTQLCMISASLGMLLLVTASLPLAILGAFLMGFGYGPSTPASSHLLAPAVSPRWRPLLFSIKQTAVPLGGAVTGVLTPALVLLWDWQWALACLSLSGFAVAVLIQPARGRYDADRARGARLTLDILPTIRTTLGEPGLRRVVVMAFAFSATQLSFSTYFVTFQVQTLGFSLEAAGLAYSIALFASVGFRIFWGAIAGGRVPGLRLLAVLSMGMAVACALTLAVEPGWPHWALIAVGVAFASCAVSWNGVLLAAIVEASSPERAAAATGGVAFFIFAGMMAGPAFFGILIAAGLSYGAAFAAIGCIAVLAGAPGLFARPAPTRPAEAVE